MIKTAASNHKESFKNTTRLIYDSTNYVKLQELDVFLQMSLWIGHKCGTHLTKHCVRLGVLRLGHKGRQS